MRGIAARSVVIIHSTASEMDAEPNVGNSPNDSVSTLAQLFSDVVAFVHDEILVEDLEDLPALKICHILPQLVFPLRSVHWTRWGMTDVGDGLCRTDRMGSCFQLLALKRQVCGLTYIRQADVAERLPRTPGGLHGLSGR